MYKEAEIGQQVRGEFLALRAVTTSQHCANVPTPGDGPRKWGQSEWGDRARARSTSPASPRDRNLAINGRALGARACRFQWQICGQFAIRGSLSHRRRKHGPALFSEAAPASLIRDFESLSYLRGWGMWRRSTFGLRVKLNYFFYKWIGRYYAHSLFYRNDKSRHELRIFIKRKKNILVTIRWKL